MHKLIESTFRKLCGHPCWQVHHDPQFHLSLNFGRPSLDIREPIPPASKGPVDQTLAATRRVTVRGEWWLWIYECHWKLSLDSKSSTRSSAGSGPVGRAIQRLDGQKIVGIEINPADGATQFQFDLGASLECRRREDDSELWTLYKPRGMVLAIFGDGTFSHEHESVPIPQQKRRPL